MGLSLALPADSEEEDMVKEVDDLPPAGQLAAASSSAALAGPVVPGSPARLSAPRTPQRSRSLAGAGSGLTSTASSDLGLVSLPPVGLQGAGMALRSPSSGRSRSKPTWTPASPPKPACQRSWSSTSRSRLTVQACSSVDGVSIQVELTSGDEVRPFSAEPLPKDALVAAVFSSGGSISGFLHIGPLAPIPFGIQVLQEAKGFAPAGVWNFVSSEHRQRTVAAAAEETLQASTGTSVQGEGVVAEVVVSDGLQADMSISIRAAKKKELTKLAQEQALQSAMERQNYSSLLAQIARSKMRKVESAQIENAERLLRSLKLPEGKFLAHTQLRKFMKWKSVTGPCDDASDIVLACSGGSMCPCNSGQAQDGEVCSIVGGAVNRALEGVAPASTATDEWLFKALVQAALAAPEGCVWKSGGKFILSNEERNQSPTAIVGLLERGNSQSDAGKALRALIAFTEQEYKFRVTAVQLNFHPNETSSHKQHRDIYGAGQKGGINCTCSFMKCQGTVCYSLGSSRRVLCETLTDKSSKYQACGEDCQGCKKYKYLHSGTAMFFNDKWNISHSHGIPKADSVCGPRISVALLCA